MVFVYAELLGNAKGTAAGIAPHAHLAMYRVCFGEDCPESDILAALDAAVEDGVDVISISLGSHTPKSIFHASTGEDILFLLPFKYYGDYFIDRFWKLHGKLQVSPLPQLLYLMTK